MNGRLSARGIAIRSAALAGGLFLLVATLIGEAGWWHLAAALFAIGLAATFFRDTRPLRERLAAPADPQSARPDFTEALAAIPDPVVIVDRRSLVVEANAAAHALAPALKRDQPLSFALRSPDVLGAVETALRSGAPQQTELVERVPVERAYEVHAAPLGRVDSENSERRGGAIIVFRDLTDARRLEKLRVDFIANASHELRTPLASVIGFIETLQGPARNDPAARERFLGIMREQAGRMSRLIDDLLSLSRIELNAHLTPSARIDIEPLVRHIVETLGPLAGERGVTIAVAADPGRYEVLGDRDELLRVFENLVENAVKYGQSGGKVDVALRRSLAGDGKAGEAFVDIRDYGPGISPEHLPRLTERFYRVDVAASRDKGGTGLGLAIVKHIVNRHRGRLQIESEPGHGALFRVVVPLVEDLQKPAG